MTLSSLVAGSSRKLATIDTTATAAEAAALLCVRYCRALIVLDAGRPIGIVTRRDLFDRGLVRRRRAGQLRVAEIMSSDLVTAPVDLDVEAALDLMNGHRISHLPILDRDEVVGILDRVELISWLAADREARIGDLMFYITHG